MATRAPAERPPERSQLDWALALAVGQLAFVAFLPALGADWVLWDDDKNFQQNLHYRGLGPEQLRWMFTTPHKGHYIPVTWLTLGFDYVLWGMKPGGYHLTNLVLHAANAALVYLVARRLFGLTLTAGLAELRVAAVLAALLFAIHPLRVESVAWVTERRDVLSGLFYLAGVLAYLGGRRRAALAACVLALGAKSMTVSFVVILLLLDVWPLRRLDLRRPAWPVLREKIPFVVVTAATCVTAFWAMITSSGITPPGALGPVNRLAISFYSIAFYLWKTAVPVALAPIYEMWTPIEPWTWPFVLSAAVAVAISALVVVARRRWSAPAVAWVAYLVMLLPVVGIVHNGPQIAADRFMYLPSLPLAFLLGAGALLAWRRLRRAGPALPHAGVALAVAVLTALAILTWRQTGIWRNSEALWLHALAASPSAIAHNNLAVVRASQERWDDVIALAQEALRLRPVFAEPHVALGEALDRKGRTDEAIAHFKEALAINPSLAAAYNHWGAALGRLGKTDEALERLKTALELDPQYPDAWHNMGVALEKTGRRTEAQRYYARARALRLTR